MALKPTPLEAQEELHCPSEIDPAGDLQPSCIQSTAQPCGLDCSSAKTEMTGHHQPLPPCMHYEEARQPPSQVTANRRIQSLASDYQVPHQFIE